MNFKRNLGVKRSNPQAPLDVGGPAMIDGRIPVMFKDNINCYIVTGFVADYTSDGYVSITAGVAYNLRRINLNDDIVLYPTNTGAAHTEYAFINCYDEVGLTLDFDSELNPKILLADVDVDDTGKATGTTDERDLNLYIGDEIAGWRKLSSMSSAPPDTMIVLSDGSHTIAAHDTWKPEAGWYNMYWQDENVYVQLYISSTGEWTSGDDHSKGSLYFDGSNMLINNDNSNDKVIYYQKLGYKVGSGNQKPSANLTVKSDGSYTLSAGESWVLDAGWYNLYWSNSYIYVELYIKSEDKWTSGDHHTKGTLFFDGSNMQIVNTDSDDHPVYYQKLG